ncbi:MAG: nucleoside 2-deoxyribosyltransferase [Myxococcaceae bacterium]
MFEVYFAGDLFDQKHITGNLALVQCIEKLFDNKFKCLLPQDIEAGHWNSGVDVRNRDIKAIIESDLVLFNFDGVDIDSGTTVEYVIAKMLDVPSVLLRTDSRSVNYLIGSDWNLMMSGFPRCAIVKQPAIVLYNELGLERTHQIIAQAVINGFQKVVQEKSVLNSYEEIITAYNHVIKLCGGGLEEIMTQELLHEVIRAKIEKNIYTV